MKVFQTKGALGNGPFEPLPKTLLSSLAPEDMIPHTATPVILPVGNADAAVAHGAVPHSPLDAFLLHSRSHHFVLVSLVSASRAFGRHSYSFCKVLREYKDSPVHTGL